MPNGWDVGSAKILAALGFEAIATTSSGFAAALGRPDQNVTRDELVSHVTAISSTVELPISVDAEAGYSPNVEGLSETVERLASAGASGISIEDYLPDRGILEVDEAAQRVAAVVEAADRHGMTVTARAENHLYGVADLGDTISRLLAFEDVGAHVLYAPLVSSIEDVTRVISTVRRPINVLLEPDGPSVGELSELGVRRVSTGGALAFASYGALAKAGRELLSEGTSTYTATALSARDRHRAFGAD